MRILSILMLFIISCQKSIPCKNTAYLDGKTYLYGDLFTGECISAHKNGELKSIMRYKEGVDDGEWRFYYNNGQLETIGWFDNGKRINEWRYYFKNGALKFSVNYLNGVKEGRSLAFDSLGTKLFEGIYKKDSLVKTVFSGNSN